MWCIEKVLILVILFTCRIDTMGRRISGERFLYVRPLDAAQIKANKIIINSRYEEVFKYSSINKGSRVIVVDEFGREYKGKMDTGKNTYLHCLGWFQGHPEVREGDMLLMSVQAEEKKRIFIGKLTNTQTLGAVTKDLPPPPERIMLKRRPGRPRKDTPAAPKKGRKKKADNSKNVKTV